MVIRATGSIVFRERVKNSYASLRRSRISGSPTENKILGYIKRDRGKVATVPFDIIPVTHRSHRQTLYHRCQCTSPRLKRPPLHRSHAALHGETGELLSVVRLPWAYLH